MELIGTLFGMADSESDLLKNKYFIYFDRIFNKNVMKIKNQI